VLFRVNGCDIYDSDIHDMAPSPGRPVNELGRFHSSKGRKTVLSINQSQRHLKQYKFPLFPETILKDYDG